MTDDDFWNTDGFEDWMEGQEEECPECGYPAEKRQIKNQEMCGRCWHARTGGVKMPEENDKWKNDQLTA